MTGILRLAGLILACAALAEVASPAAGLAQTALLEVEKSDATKVMQVYDDAGLIVGGRFGSGTIPGPSGGTRLMWYPGKAAFRAGVANQEQWDDANIGPGSAALGANTMASGIEATALGNGTTASGQRSTAMGAGTTASAGFSTAMGFATTASGTNSTAMGIRATASGNSSTAMGTSTTASGGNATAMGSHTTAGGLHALATGAGTKALGNSSTAMGEATTAVGANTTALGKNAAAFGNGSFAYGDASTTSAVISALENQFVVRAAGGFRFRTKDNLSTGCDLEAGSGTFNCTSSRLAKEGFAPLDGELVLIRIANLPIQRWRYRGTGVSHVGPTAEDFHAAFEVGAGPTTISTVDADGISLLGVQALERRTAELKEENAELRAELVSLRSVVDRLATLTLER